MLRWCLVYVMSYLNSLHSLLFKLCIEHVYLIFCTYDKYFLIFRTAELNIFPSEMLRGVWSVICSSSSLHSFIFKLSIMIVHTLKCAPYILCTIDNIYLSVELIYSTFRFCFTAFGVPFYTDWQKNRYMLNFR